MRAPMIVEIDPIADNAAGVLQGLESMSMRALRLRASALPCILKSPALFAGLEWGGGFPARLTDVAQKLGLLIPHSGVREAGAP